MFTKKRLEKLKSQVMDLDTLDFQRLLAVGFADFCRDNLRRPDVFVSLVDDKFLVSVINEEEAVEKIEKLIDGCQRLIEDMKKND